MDRRLKPVISHYRDIEHLTEVYTLVVPDFWLMTTRWPRLRLTWFLVKLAFQAGSR
jgi:hypothetical protein